MLRRVLAWGSEDRFTTALPLALGAIVLGWGLQVSNGTLAPAAFAALNVTLGLSLLALGNPAEPRLEARGDLPLRAVTAIGLALQLRIHLTAPPGIYLDAAANMTVHHTLIGALGALSAAVLVAPLPLVKRVFIPGVLLVHFLLGLWLLRASPNPGIDTFVWHRVAFEELLAGKDPYAMSMPNLYGDTKWYAPGLADKDHVFVGFPYPPISLGVALLGHVVAGDYRYANLVALTAAGAMMAYARPHRLGPIMALVFLCTPRMFFVLEQGWTEAFVIFFLSLSIFFACRSPRLTGLGLGLLFAIKQYSVFLAPMAFLLLARAKDATPRAIARLLAVGCALTAFVTLPFFFWDMGAFLASVVTFQGKQPFREESLSFVAWTAKDGRAVLPLWLSFVPVPFALFFALYRAPRSPAGFAMAAAVIYGLFFAFAKQAFCNYYFLVIGSLCLAAAALDPVTPSGGSTAASREDSPASPSDAPARASTERTATPI